MLLNAWLLFGLLLGTWLVLSGFFSLFFIVLGLISCGVAVFVSVKVARAQSPMHNMFPVLIRMPGYAFWLIKEMVKSSLKVTKRVWQVEPDISPVMGWVPTVLHEDVGLALYGNSITLTPGTVTISVNEDSRLQVHALCEDDFNALREGDMARHVMQVVFEEYA
jgi:multicomponent Na+:H+ antiporter subunit E